MQTEPKIIFGTLQDLMDLESISVYLYIDIVPKNQQIYNLELYEGFWLHDLSRKFESTDFGKIYDYFKLRRVKDLANFYIKTGKVPLDCKNRGSHVFSFHVRVKSLLNRINKIQKTS